MGSVAWRLSAGTLLLLAMSGCSAGGGADGGSPASAGGVEMRVSQTCSSGSIPNCVLVNDVFVEIDSAGFVHAGVDAAEVADNGGTDAVRIEFDAEGAKTFQNLTAETARLGGTGRLVIKVGDTVLSAVSVPEPMSGNSVTIGLAPDQSAEEFIEMIKSDKS